MLEVEGKETYVARCDACRKPSTAIIGSRELAITRLMLMQWHLRTYGGATSALCPACKPPTNPGVAKR